MNEIILKQVEPIHGISLRRTYRKNDPNQSFDEFCEAIWQELEKNISKYSIPLTTPCMTRYFKGLFFDQTSPQIDLEIIEPISKPLPLKNLDTLQSMTLPAQKVVSTIHRGKLSEIGTSFDQMMLWLQKNHYEITGPIREIYHQVETDPSTGDTIPITELQIPVTD